MQWAIVGAIVFVSIIIVTIGEKIFKAKRPLKNAISFTLSGTLSLFIVNFFALMTSVEIPYSYFNFALSSLLGIPGVISLIFVNMLI